MRNGRHMYDDHDGEDLGTYGEASWGLLRGLLVAVWGSKNAFPGRVLLFWGPVWGLGATLKN